MEKKFDHSFTFWKGFKFHWKWSISVLDHTRWSCCSMCLRIYILPRINLRYEFSYRSLVNGWKQINHVRRLNGASTSNVIICPCIKLIYNFIIRKGRIHFRLCEISKKSFSAIIHGFNQTIERTIPNEQPLLADEVSDNFLRIEGVAWSALRIPTAVFSVFRPKPLLFLPSSSLVVLTRLSRPRSRPPTSQKIW
jgi:hypothetical protein